MVLDSGSSSQSGRGEGFQDSGSSSHSGGGEGFRDRF